MGGANHDVVPAYPGDFLDLRSRLVGDGAGDVKQVHHHEGGALAALLDHQRFAVEGIQHAVRPARVVIARHGNAQWRRDVRLSRTDAGLSGGGLESNT